MMELGEMIIYYMGKQIKLACESQPNSNGGLISRHWKYKYVGREAVEANMNDDAMIMTM